jgi:hypothetical protein
MGRLVPGKPSNRREARAGVTVTMPVHGAGAWDGGKAGGGRGGRRGGGGGPSASARCSWLAGTERRARDHCRPVGDGCEGKGAHGALVERQLVA